MPKCKPCLCSEVKEFLSQMRDTRIDSILAQVPDCPDSRDIVLCRKEESKSKRGASPYNIFIGECMKGKVKSFGQAAGVMKQCAGEWRERKK